MTGYDQTMEPLDFAGVLLAFLPMAILALGLAFAPVAWRERKRMSKGVRFLIAFPGVSALGIAAYLTSVALEDLGAGSSASAVLVLVAVTAVGAGAGLTGGRPDRMNDRGPIAAAIVAVIALVAAASIAEAAAGSVPQSRDEAHPTTAPITPVPTTSPITPVPTTGEPEPTGEPQPGTIDPAQVTVDESVVTLPGGTYPIADAICKAGVPGRPLTVDLGMGAPVAHAKQGDEVVPVDIKKYDVAPCMWVATRSDLQTMVTGPSGTFFTAIQDDQRTTHLDPGHGLNAIALLFQADEYLVWHEDDKGVHVGRVPAADLLAQP